MQNELISIIIPIFNTSRYLKKCISSVLKQSYSNLEILLILDGEQKKEKEICNKIAVKDKRIKIYIKEHTGVSDTRNYGIRVSKGKFICFLDGDDWLPKNAILDLYESLIKTNTQLSIGAITTVSEYGKKFLKYKDQVLDLEEKETLIESIFSLNSPLGYMAAKLYYKDIIIKNNILFDINMECYEDTYFTCQYLQNCNKIVFFNKNVYYYNRFNSTAATKKYQENRNKWEIKKILIQLELCKNISNKNKKYVVESIEKQFYNLCNYYFNIVSNRTIIFNKIEETKKLYYSFILENKILNLNDTSDLIFYTKGTEDLIKEFTKMKSKNDLDIIKKIKYKIRRIWSYILQIYYFKI